MLRRLLMVLVAVGLAETALAAVACARPSAGLVLPEQVGGYLRAYLQAEIAGDRAEARRQLDNGRARWDGPLLSIQLHLTDPDALPDAALTALGGRVEVRGQDLMDVWLAPARVVPLLHAHPEISFAQLPWRPVSLRGPHQSQGAERLHPPELQCLGTEGQGVPVAVIDEDFEGIEQSLGSGEVGSYKAGNKIGLSGSHGTMCAEVVADVAASAPLVLYSVASLASMQAIAKEITQKGNPNGIRVVSHSVGWFGQSFGRHTGPLCAVTDQVRSADIVWVNAAGNNGGGSFYAGVWTDTDKDGSHEISPGEKRLQFRGHSWAPIQLIIDWDDYEARKIDLNATLWRKDGDDWVVETSSKLKQGKNTPSAEWIIVQQPKSADYGLEITALNPASVPAGLRIRVVSTGGGVGFSAWTDNGNVYDPASCKGVLAVGALRWSRYDQGPLEDYSSFGPTVDGRQKPEVVAPTGTATSAGDFYGTSAACPHAAGVAALLRSAWPQATADEVVSLMLQQTTPMGDGAVPDDAYGYGRIEVTGAELGWQCTATVAGPADATCTTACGSVGSHACGASCRWSDCLAPTESCNGKDDNCDGTPDESFTCMLGAVATCTTDDGVAGSHTCSSLCAWNPCTVAADALVGGDAPASDAVSPPDARDGQADGGCQAGRSARGWSPGAAGLLALAATLLVRRRRLGR